MGESWKDEKVTIVLTLEECATVSATLAAIAKQFDDVPDRDIMLECSYKIHEQVKDKYLG